MFIGGRLLARRAIFLSLQGKYYPPPVLCVIVLFLISGRNFYALSTTDLINNRLFRVLGAV